MCVLDAPLCPLSGRTLIHFLRYFQPAGTFVRRRPESDAPVVVQDAKLKQLPMLVIMPGDEIRYAHKLSPEYELDVKPVAKKVEDVDEAAGSGAGGGAALAADSAAGPSGGVAGEAVTAPSVSAGPLAAAAAADGAAAEGAAAPPQERRSMRARWSGRSMSAAEMHAQRQAERLEEHVRALAQLSLPPQPQVGILKRQSRFRSVRRGVPCNACNCLRGGVLLYCWWIWRLNSTAQCPRQVWLVCPGLLMEFQPFCSCMCLAARP